MKNLFSVFIYVLISMALVSCSDDGDNSAFGSIELEFDNVVGESELELNTANEPYTNAAGETYSVTTLRYYISKIKLKQSDGSIFEDEVTANGSKGYYLIDEADGESQHIELEGIPVGDYTEITFTIGVDAQNISTPVGVLATDNGMFWDWDLGYIAVMLEGNSAASGEDGNKILYHVGGFSDPSNNIKTKTLEIEGTGAHIRSDKTPEVHIIVDVNMFFDSPNEISFADTPVQEDPADNIKVSANYIRTFVVDHVHN